MDLKEFLEKYKPEEKTLRIDDRSFIFFFPRDIIPFINEKDPISNFPLWARMWEGAIVLIDYLCNQRWEKAMSFLEIGAGIGFVGIVTASLGHRVTITDYNEDALNFIHANALKNLREDEIKRVKVKKCDWNRPDLDEKYDYIIGSDVIFREEDFEPILSLFDRYLKEDGEIILSEGIRKSSLKFLEFLDKGYNVKAIKKILRSKDGEIPVILIKAKRAPKGAL